MTGRWVGGTLGVAAVLLAALGVHHYVTDHDAGPAATPDPERAAALQAAHQVQSTVKGTFLVATYRPDAGLHGQSNTGHSCARRTLLVRLVWNGANFTHAAGRAGYAHANHQALVATVNATTGVPCLIGASYGSAAADPKPGELYLYGPRKDLVTTQ